MVNNCKENEERLIATLTPGESGLKPLISFGLTVQNDLNDSTTKGTKNTKKASQCVNLRALCYSQSAWRRAKKYS